MMRILLIADFDFKGGTGTYFKRIIPYLSAKGKLHIILSKKQITPEVLELLNKDNVSFSSDLYLFPKLENILMRIFRRLGFLHWYGYFRDFIIQNRLRRKYRPDVFFLSQSGGERFFSFLKLKCPAIIVCHSLWMENYNQKKIGHLFKKMLVSNNYLKNKKIITVSNGAKNLFVNYFSDSFNAITEVVPNYALQGGTCLDSDDKSLEKKEKVVLTLGHISVFKNPAVWLKTVSLVSQRYKGSVKFIWAGRPLDWNIYKKDFEEQKNAEFIGFVEDTESLYNNATIYFQPSLQESQGIAVVEALAHSLPCVVSSVGGLPESVTDGVEGFVRKYDDAEGFASGIILMLENKSLLEQMRRNAYNKYKTTFTKTAWESKMDLIFDSCVLGA